MATRVSVKRNYEEFEPYCKWEKSEISDILQIHLQGFKKEQLKVQINSIGVLSIAGERPLDGSKWCRFRKEFQVPEDSKTNEIRAKFSSGVLHITLPRKPPHQVPAGPSQDGGKLKPSNGNAATGCGLDADASNKNTRKASPVMEWKCMALAWLKRLRMERETAVKVAAGGAAVVVAMVVLTLVAYGTHKYYLHGHLEN